MPVWVERMLRIGRLAAAVVFAGVVAVAASETPAWRMAADSESPRGVRVAQADGVACRDVQMASLAIPGAASLLRVLSPCAAGLVVTVVHAEIEFTRRLDDTGRGDFAIPLMDGGARALIVMPDGGSVEVALEHEPAELAAMYRVALVWTAPVTLDLHAVEFAGELWSDAHVWSGAPKDFEAVKATGGGFMQSFEAAAEAGQNVDVYSYWTARASQRGVVRIAVDHVSRGETARPPFCDDGALAAPRYQLIQSARGEIVSRLTRRIARAPCGMDLGLEVRLAGRPTDDLRIAPAR